MLKPTPKIVCFLLSFIMTTDCIAASPLRCVMYLTGQHPVIPSLDRVRHVTHVALAFLPSSIFNEENRTSWPLFLDPEHVRHYFPPSTQIMVAIGGWGDTAGFELAARSADSRKLFARNMARMVEATNADGVDIDWEYPGGNGEDYKQVPNDQKAWQIGAYPLLLAEIRSALGKSKLISAAVPGQPGDMIAFTRSTVPRIMNHVDFLNVMSYDLMNRRHNVTMHHSGVENSLVAVEAYIAAGAAPRDLNLGLGFYVKWFKTEHENCLGRTPPLGCRTLLMEDPETGADLGRAGMFAWHDTVPEDLASSFGRVQEHGTYDETHGGYCYWDEEVDLWWTYDTPDAILRKFPQIIERKRLGGVFAWGLGEDAPKFRNLDAVSNGLKLRKRGQKKDRTDEL